MWPWTHPRQTPGALESGDHAARERISRLEAQVEQLLRERVELEELRRQVTNVIRSLKRAAAAAESVESATGRGDTAAPNPSLPAAVLARRRHLNGGT